MEVEIQNRITTAWIGQTASVFPATLAETFAPFGIHVVQEDGLSPAGTHAQLRVLDLSRAEDGEAAVAQLGPLQSDVQPTLVLTASSEQMAAAMHLLRPIDDVANASDPPSLIAGKLLRLVKLSQITRELSLYRNNIDLLTGLPNRKQLHTYLHEGSTVRPDDSARALILIDLDHFESVNDQFGTIVGDQILREAATRLQAIMQPDDRLFRLDGDEFTCVLRRDTRQVLVEDAEAARCAVQFGEFPSSAGPVRVSASAGLAFFDSTSDMSMVTRQADMAMYLAKYIGRENLVVYDDLQRLASKREIDISLHDYAGAARLANDRLGGMINTVARQMVQQAQLEANQDALTLLHNRRYFDARITREVEMARSDGRPLTVAMIDIDHFREVNNTYGHPTGDTVLRAIAGDVRNSIRAVDWVARYGGEEFCLVMPATLTDGMQVAERVRRNIESLKLTSLDGRLVPVTVSIGIVQLASDMETHIDLIQQASEQTHAAKEGGRNCIVAGHPPFDG